MKVNWHKSETREVRPFFAAETLGEILAHARIRPFEDGQFVETESFVLSERDLGRLSPTLKPGFDASVVKDCKAVDAKELLLVVSATNPFLKKTLVVGTFRASSRLPEEVPIGSEILEALGGGNNLVIDVALCLSHDAPKTPGVPFLRGHWVSKKSFYFGLAKLPEDFDVEPVDDAGWRARGLPAKTMYYVEYIGPVNERTSKDQSIAKVYVHADVYKRLASETNPKAVRSIQAFLAAEIVAQILAASAKDWESADEPELGSPLAAVLKRVNKVQKCDLKALRALVDEPGLQRLRALLHADQETVRAIVEG
jgi:hypothetical protein